MVMYCPYCQNKLAGRIGRSCGSCGKDITFLATALEADTRPLSDEMREAALFHEYLSQDNAVAKDLERGDLIEIFHGFFQHWAVYIGDGYIVHLVATGIGISGVSIASMSGRPVSGQVKKEKLKDVVSSADKWKKNNIQHTSYDNKLKPRPKEEIVKEAVSMVGKDVEYDVARWNCEHFATLCRYGKAISLQVQKTAEAATAAASGILGSFSSSF